MIDRIRPAPHQQIEARGRAIHLGNAGVAHSGSTLQQAAHGCVVRQRGYPLDPDPHVDFGLR